MSSVAIDSRGISRGGCEACGCDGYDGGDKQRKCVNCGHPPGKHENLDSQTAAKSTLPVPSTSTLPAVPTPQSSTSGGSAYARFTGFFTKMFASHPAQPHQSAPIDGFKVTPATGCAVPGCGRPVEFDANTGKEYACCGEHIGSAAASLPLSGCVQMEQDGNGCGGTGMFIPGGQQHDTGTLVDSTTGAFNTPNLFPSLPPATPKCALPGCYNPPYIDENGTVHKCCGRTHAREFEALSTATAMPPPLSASLGPPPPGPVPPISSGGLPPDKKCAIVECQNPRFVDESGTVHECCGITHAMEHQRRLALMKQTNQQVIKGVTHCYLPGCNRPTWPFMNYCGRTHAQQGQQQGLPPPPSLTSGPATGSGAAAASAAPKTSSMCLIPECQQPKYVDPTSGVTHDFCGKSHADEGKRRGIRPQADKPEDECDLPGCTNKKRTEGTRVHDYCCRDHASQDAPNLAARILTSHAEVQKFLQKFSNLTVASLDENTHAKPGGQLFSRFKNAFDNLPKQHRKTCLAFHGTPEKNIQSICSNGYDPNLRSGQAYGPGEYFATSPSTPLSYCRGGKKMLLNELLLGQSGTHHTQSGDIIVMKNPDHDLPRYVITFK